MIFPGPERPGSIRAGPGAASARPAWKRLRGAALLVALCVPSARAAEPGPGPAEAVAPALLAAICASCHRADNTAIPSLHGRPAAQLREQLLAMPRQSDLTVMHRLTAGLTPIELDAVAAWLAEAPP